MTPSFLDQVKALDLRRGDWLAVFGDIQSTSDRIASETEIDRLLETLLGAVGENGHILVPTFTQGSEFHETSSPAATSRLAERFRQRPDVVRSRHVTHSVAVWGPNAREIVRHHDLYLPFLIETPLGQLIANKGKALLFGGDQKNNPLIHVARFSVKREHPIIWVNISHLLEFGGRRRKRNVAPPCSRAYSLFGPELERHGIAISMETDWGRIVGMEAVKVFDYMVEAERNFPHRFLCDKSTCRWCSEMRQILDR